MSNFFKQVIAVILIVSEGAVVLADILDMTSAYEDVDEALALSALFGSLIYTNVRYILYLHQQNSIQQKHPIAEIFHKNQKLKQQAEMDKVMAEEIHGTDIEPEEYESLLGSHAEQDAEKEQTHE